MSNNKYTENFSHQYSEDNITWFNCTKSDSEGYAELGYIIRPLPPVDVVENKEERVEDAAACFYWDNPDERMGESDADTYRKGAKFGANWQQSQSAVEKSEREFEIAQLTIHSEHPQRLLNSADELIERLSYPTKSIPSVNELNLDERAKKFAANNFTGGEMSPSHYKAFVGGWKDTHASFVALVEGEIAVLSGRPEVYRYTLKVLTDLLNKIK